MRMLAPKHFHLCGAKAHCPDGFVVVFSETNSHAAHQQTLLRKAGENDTAFWERVVSTAQGLLAGRPGDYGLIVCKYHPPSVEEAEHGDRLFNGSNLSWHAVNHGMARLSA